MVWRSFLILMVARLNLCFTEEIKTQKGEITPLGSYCCAPSLPWLLLFPPCPQTEPRKDGLSFSPHSYLAQYLAHVEMSGNFHGFELLMPLKFPQAARSVSLNVCVI